MMKTLFSMAAILFCMSFGQVYAQVSGQVTDDDGIAVSDASVKVEGSNVETFTDDDGNYTIDAQVGDVLLIEGGTYPLQEVTVSGDVQNVTLSSGSGNTLDEAIFLGSRRKGRSVLESAVPVDVIDVKEVLKTNPQVNLNQILNQVAPSFNSNTQTISDGTDHIDPASLRGLGPDQVLVLINGKRRHTSSLINVNGTFGRGQVGTDLNAIPAASIERIEILRDGAAAQYGTDAIAGVINIVLKSDEALNVQVTQGGFFSENSNGQTGGVDGETVNVAASLGFKLNENGGFLNLSGDFDYREPTNRMREFEGQIFNAYNSIEWVALQSGADLNTLQNSLSDVQFYAQGVTHFDLATKNAISNAGSLAEIQDLLRADTTDAELAVRNQNRSDYNMRVGQSGLRSGRFMANLSLPLNNGAELYAFGGISSRRGNSAGFYRLPHQDRTYTALYPNGFLPEINSNILDQSISAGIRGEYMGWDVDFSNTYGRNQFLFEISNTSNASLQADSPTTFDAGGHAFAQNTTNLDFSRFYDGILQGLNVAFGAEYRTETYEIFEGEEASYTTYGSDGNPFDGSNPATDVLGRARPGGAQVFPGFSEANALRRSRNNIAAYLDFDADVTDKWNVGVAGRYENYSDFGDTFNWKVSTLYRLFDGLNLRAAASTGFRAPSLHQLSFANVSTIFVDIEDENGESMTVTRENLVAPNDSQVARVLDIPELTQEESFSVSAGLTANIKSANLTLTADAYYIAIDDRVVLTGQFTGEEIAPLLEPLGANSAAFFANAIDTQTRGFDLVATHRATLGSKATLVNELAGTFTQTERVDEINSSQTLRDAGLESTYFAEDSRVYLEEAVPRTKIRLAHTLNMGKFTGFLSNIYFGEVTEASLIPANQQQFDGKIITNLSLGYDLFKNFNITVGANNLLDVYPDRAIDANRSSGRFDWSRRAPQIGIGGRFLFARFSLNLK